MSEKVAVLGAGISGLAAAYDLQKNFEVTLFDAQLRLGGNANTVETRSSDGKPLAVDSGVIIYYDACWPSLFDELGIRAVPVPQELSLATVRCSGCGFSFGSMGETFGEPPTRPDVSNQVWEHFVEDFRKLPYLFGGDTALTPERLVDTEGYSRYFVEHMIVPMVASAYVMSEDAARRCSVPALLKMLAEARMVPGSPLTTMLRIPEHSSSYVDVLAKNISFQELGTTVEAVIRHGYGVHIRDAAGRTHDFDKVVLAVPADRALEMLVNATPLQREVLSRIPYDYNQWTLHTDDSLPHREGLISYQLTSCTGGAHINLPHNAAQEITDPVQYISTATFGGGVPDPELVLQTVRHGIVILTPQAVVAQQQLPRISDSTIAFAGAYFGDSGHDNALASGRNAARILVGKPPSGGIRDMQTMKCPPWRAGTP
ncbi:FAD-dependent oxidoreductase [Nocardia brasiliensis]|uniref:FAD-dependent oxidoreductase n=1 Tax=Nocardia brasiliensis TaxID=37326 RepID=UPI0009DD1124|nr:FAD-dependent oxidoreductase [Nocardia brasiliensis]